MNKQQECNLYKIHNQWAKHALMYDPFKQFSSLALARILEEMSLDLGSAFFCTTTALITEEKKPHES